MQPEQPVVVALPQFRTTASRIISDLRRDDVRELPKIWISCPWNRQEGISILQVATKATRKNWLSAANAVREGALKRRRPEEPGRRGYIKARISPVCFGFVFSPSFIFNNMAGFVFGFVFSTGTYFQQLPGFVFGFVWVRFLSRSFVFNNFSGSFFKKRVFCPTHFSSKPTDPFFQRVTEI